MGARVSRWGRWGRAYVEENICAQPIFMITMTSFLPATCWRRGRMSIQGASPGRPADEPTISSARRKGNRRPPARPAGAHGDPRSSTPNNEAEPRPNAQSSAIHPRPGCAAWILAIAAAGIVRPAHDGNTGGGAYAFCGKMFDLSLFNLTDPFILIWFVQRGAGRSLMRKRQKTLLIIPGIPAKPASDHSEYWFNSVSFRHFSRLFLLLLLLLLPGCPGSIAGEAMEICSSC